MTFLWPAMLWALLLLPFGAALYARLLRRRSAAWPGGRWVGAAAADPGAAGAGRGVGARRHIPAVLMALALAILIVALARPHAEVSLPRLEGTVVLAFDVSASMAATDVLPTRMEAAIAAAAAFVQSQPSTVQIGVVAFSNSGLAVQVPSNDQAAILAAINRLTPQRGTSLGQGILAALSVINPSIGDAGEAADSPASPTPATTGQAATGRPAIIVLLTDGENNSNPDPLEVALAAAERGVRIYTVGLGSPEGINLELEGFTVHTQLDEPALRQIARLGGGAYYNAQDEPDLRMIYDEVATQLVIKPEAMEITSLLAGAGMFIVLIAAGLSMAWFGRVP